MKFKPLYAFVTKNIKKFIRPLLVTLGILLTPFLGNIFVEGWNWKWTAFAFLGSILFSAGILYEFFGKNAKKGVFGGFIFGEFIALCIIATLRYLNSSDDIAGIVIITFLFCGLLFATIGYFIQKYLK